MLRDYQAADVLTAKRARWRLLLALEERLGKSYVATAVLRRARARKALIVAPLGEPIRDFRNHAIKQEGLSLADPKKCLVRTINWEMIEKRADSLIDWNPDAIIADECHRLRDSQSAQSQALYLIADNCDPFVRLGLSGTPYDKSELDLYGIFRFIDPEILNMSLTAFRKYYAHRVSLNSNSKGVPLPPFMYKPKKIKCKELLITLSKNIVTRERRDHFDETPVEPDLFIDYKLKSSLRAYREMKLKAITTFNDKTIRAKNKLSVYLRLRQILSGHTKDVNDAPVVVGTEKITAFKTWAKAYEKKDLGQLVIITEFRGEVDDLCKVAGELGIPFIRIDGRDTKKKNQYTKDFREGKAKWLIANSATISEGTQLYNACQMLFYNIGYSYIRHKQCRSRIADPVLQTRNKQYHYMRALNTVDEHSLDVLNTKKDVIRRIRRILS